ncbi:histidine kinase dimerization/phospho-acceptor domain-containing protein [Variovorax sp. UMC13]|uniref:histidine kinase dimerization/phospho-acceptor domain-containing protein n=1 Tax=Variovorax sp. UMC13 TaxID=1862326 RepID=UPI00160128E3|nr:histidine kinase dimerization/phospho-acceptor domain-containing protein [Variovorax sp. UMC13]
MNRAGTPRPSQVEGAVAEAPGPALHDFLEQLDHDLRTPLGTMVAALELLRHEPAGTPLHAESIDVLERQLGRLLSLTDGLRKFSRTLSD